MIETSLHGGWSGMLQVRVETLVCRTHASHRGTTETRQQSNPVHGNPVRFLAEFGPRSTYADDRRDSRMFYPREVLWVSSLHFLLRRESVVLVYVPAKWSVSAWSGGSAATYVASHG